MRRLFDEMKSFEDIKQVYPFARLLQSHWRGRQDPDLDFATKLQAQLEVYG